MARKITEAVVTAFMRGETLRLGNTRTDGNKLWLHGNLIATKQKGGLYITNAGWATNTTKERLNALPGVSIKSVKGQWYLNGDLWRGELKQIG